MSLKVFQKKLFALNRLELRRPNLRILLPALAVAVLGAGLPRPAPPQTSLEQVYTQGRLNAAVRVGPLIYYLRDDQAAGLDYVLLESLARDLGVILDISVHHSIPELLNAVSRQESHLGSANLTVTPARAKRYSFSLPYLHVSPVLIQHSLTPRVRSLDQLPSNANLVAIEGSSHAELLRRLRSGEHPDLSWYEEPDTIMFDLMQRVQNREIDFAAIDSTIFDLERPYFPRVEVAMELSDPQPVAWVLAPQTSGDLVTAVNRFINQLRESGELGEIVRSYYLHNEPFNVAGSLTLLERIEKRLPDLEPMFREVAGELEMDWILLAATSYQESHWDPQARSPTGVRGLMMLTLPTARHYGVDNRLDAEQSLRAGAAYLKSLHQRIPERIGEPDRTKLALAAYNIGMGHLEDARILTQRNGGNPDSWDQVKAHLPLLQRREYFSTLRHGYARGTEAVTYVDNIYHFQRILQSHAWQTERNMRQDFFEEVPNTSNNPARSAWPGLPLGPVQTRNQGE